MIQALHALLGNENDKTSISMLYGCRSTEDMLLKESLNRWRTEHKERFNLAYVLSDTSDSSNDSNGANVAILNGFITKEMVAKYLPSPEEDALLFVCGPPPFYEILCGERQNKELKMGSILQSLGYRDNQIIKF